MTDFRATYEVSDEVALVGLLVNGWNNSVDNNVGKTGGLQLTFQMPSSTFDGDLLSGAIGYLGGPEQPDTGLASCAGGQTFDQSRNECNATPGGLETFPVDLGSSNTKGLRHFIDVVFHIQPSEELGILLNGDFGMERVRQSYDARGGTSEYATEKWWGLSAAARYALDRVWALAARGEVYGDPDGRATPPEDGGPDNVDLTLYSGTLTVESRPAEELVVKLDGRLDVASEPVFFRQLRSFEKNQFTLTLGVVIMTND
jgi:hypothetical protein